MVDANEIRADSGEIPDLSIVVLGYKAGEELIPFIKQIEAIFDNQGIRYEIVIVANYWPNTGDATPEIAQNLAQSNPLVKVVTREKQGYMGWDMRTGFEAATGAVIAVIDGDNQFPPDTLLPLYERLIDEQKDLCKTVRISREDGAYRITISKVYNLIFKLFFPGSSFKDVNSKPKLLTRRAYGQLELRNNSWFIDAEIMIQARRYGFKIAELPTPFRKNTRASFVKVSAILEFCYELVKARILEFGHGR